MFPHRLPLAVGLICLFSPSVPLHLAAQSAQAGSAVHEPAVLQIVGLGKGTAPLEGPWQFHVGDNPAFAEPETADATGVAGWEQLSPDKTWGAQGHPAYTGYAWYRKHLHFSPAPGAPGDVYLLVPHIDNAYQVYWNGRLMGQNGVMPPHPSFPYAQPGQIFNLGGARDGVLALRVWKSPLTSFDSDQLGGLYAAPLAGSLEDITGRKTGNDYEWLRSNQFDFGLRSLSALVMLLSLLAWFRNRSHRVLLAMAVFSGFPVMGMFLTDLRLPISFSVALGCLQPVLSMQDIGLWFLLLYLLELDGNRRLARITSLLAIVSLSATSLDGALTLLDWSKPWLATWVQMADALLTAIFTLVETYPFVLLGFAVRKHLDPARWLLAFAALLTEMIFVVRVAVAQGSRFTHWTLADRIAAPLFYFNGNAFTAQTLANTLLLLAIIYAVYRYMQETMRRQGALEQEFKSARELQQVLIPESLPALPGFAFTSAYRPAQEVGGDFFQIIPLEGEYAGSTLIVLGDVSGKGLRAAMTVSLIVGAGAHAGPVRSAPRREILSELNKRLHGRLQGGFATCLALLLRPDGRCVMASAGHPAPFLNKHELDLPGALPLGIARQRTLRGDGHPVAAKATTSPSIPTACSKPAKPTGEIFSFERLDALFATRPDAARSH